MKVTLLTITKRTGLLDIIFDSLKRQTVWKELTDARDIEWIYVDELAHQPARRDAFKKVCADLGIQDYQHLYPADYSPPRFGKLCRASNTGLDAAQGDYLLMLNDGIWLPDDAIEKILATIGNLDGAPLLVTTLNHRTRVPPKSACVDLATADTSYSIFLEPFDPKRWGFPDTVELYGTDAPRDRPQYPSYHTNPIDWEAPFALAPTAILRAIGGWDEGLDYGYAHDNILVAQKFLAADPKARIHLAKNIRVISIDHQTYFADPPTMAAALRRNQRIVVPDTAPTAPILFSSSRQRRASVGTRPSICFYLPELGNWKKIDPTQPFKNALGGRETAAIRLAQELAKIGWDSAVAAPLTMTSYQEDGGPLWQTNDNIKMKWLSSFDVCVGMDHRLSFQTIRARLNVVHFQCTYPSDNLLPVPWADEYVDCYALLSNYQRYTLRSADPSINADKCVIFGNGIDLARYDSIDVTPVPGRLVWSSSPERGLVHLLRWWPTLKARYPHLSLRVFYNIKALEPYRWSMQLQAEWLRWIENGATLDGVDYVGPIDQTTLAREQKQAEIFVYPCDPTASTESWCITALENCAARVPMLLSNADCLPEVYGGQREAAWFGRIPVRDEEWVSAVAALLDDPKGAARTLGNARALAESYTWTKLAARWDAFLRARLALAAVDTDAILELSESASIQPVLSTA